MLGFYDLCAVLTPCGPLKALVGLLQKDEENNEGRGMIPGLLYEAKLPVKRGTKREGEELKRDAADNEENGDDNDQPPPPASPPKGPLPVPLALALTLRLKVIDEAEGECDRRAGLIRAPFSATNSNTPLLNQLAARPLTHQNNVLNSSNVFGRPTCYSVETTAPTKPTVRRATA